VKQLKRNAVTGAKIKRNAVTGAKVLDRSLTASDLMPGVVPPPLDAYTKLESDGRYLGDTVVVVKRIAGSLGPDEFEFGSVDCPPGYHAISGGVDIEGIYAGKVSASSPMIGGERVTSSAEGTHQRSTGWFGAVTTQGAAPGFGIDHAEVVAICAVLR
jgi:hypothetical protein